jgi:hypothetical protein
MELLFAGFVVVLIALVLLALVAQSPWVLIPFGGGFLALAYLALAFSWDAWHTSAKGFEGMGAGPQVMVFITAPVGMAALFISLILLGRAWGSPARWFTPLALLPCVLAVAYYTAR